MMARQKQLTLQGDKAVEPAAQIGAVAAPLSPMEMLASALERGQSPELIEKLMDLAERWQTNQARRAFDTAMADAKAKIKPIAKNRKVDFTSSKGRTNYEYEDLAEIARSVDPILAEVGLAYRFQSRQDGDTLTITCIMSHRDGHSIENSLSARRDESGNKNAIQGVASTATYLQRYTLKLSLGLAASIDDDGKASGAPGTITAKQWTALHDLLIESGANRDAFLTLYKIGDLDDLPASKFEDAKAKLERKLKMKQAQEAAEVVQEAPSD